MAAPAPAGDGHAPAQRRRGGIGIAAIQHAKARGARVIAVASSDDKRAIATQAGADDVIAPDGFKDAVMELTDGRGVDIVVDPVGGDRFTDSLRSLAVEGRLLVIGFTGGAIPEVKVNRLLLNNVSVVGVGWGAYALSRPGHVGREWEAMLPHLRSGALRPVVGAYDMVLGLGMGGAAVYILGGGMMIAGGALGAVPEVAPVAGGGAGIGVGLVAGNFLSGALRNPSAAASQTATLFIGMAFAEALGIFSFLVALLLLFAA